tara:strand:+ start:143 stop:364 length:222 start_codon:yes stop_codon:yes gene_type:complete
MRSRRAINSFMAVLAGVAGISLFGWVGNEDFKDEVRAQVRYCEMVEADVWPDYNNTFQYCDKAYAALRKIKGE